MAPRRVRTGRTATPDPGMLPPVTIAPDAPPDEPLDEAADEAADEAEIGPLRRCAVTRERLPKATMIRFVAAPADGAGPRLIVPDLTATLPGRGIWLSARGDVIETACNRGAFAKAIRGPVLVPPDLLSGLQAALERRLVDTLGLARRAGQAVAGFVKAREWLAAGRAGLVMQARDGSADERARFLGGHAAQVPVVDPLDAARLGAVFGRDHAVHVVVSPGRLAERLASEAQRLAGLRAKPPDAKAPDARAPGSGVARTGLTVSGRRPDGGRRDGATRSSGRPEDMGQGAGGR